ncbi:MAG: hypothetical protein RIS90_223 [Pseudomonadota bacterium]
MRAWAALVLGLSATASLPAQTRSGGEAKALPASRVELQSKAKQMASGIRAADDALTPDELALALQVHAGRLPCELGAFVLLVADPNAPGYFDVQLKGRKFRMVPVATSTGAIRLEDRRQGAVWLQLADKSMLMDQRLGKRLVDACVSVEQALVAARLLKEPAPSVLESLPVVAIK